MPLRKYLHKPHRSDCDCSVCWINRNWGPPAPVTFRSIQCIECRPAQWSRVNGRNHVTPAFTCAKHTPSARPPNYWHEYSNTGKPTPFVPIHEPFELER
ncbi:lysogeny maintenance protein PflM [Pseudomonas sp. Marseille-Q8238]